MKDLLSCGVNRSSGSISLDIRGLQLVYTSQKSLILVENDQSQVLSTFASLVTICRWVKSTKATLVAVGCSNGSVTLVSSNSDFKVSICNSQDDYGSVQCIDTLEIDENTILVATAIVRKANVAFYSSIKFCTFSISTNQVECIQEISMHKWTPLAIELLFLDKNLEQNADKLTERNLEKTILMATCGTSNEIFVYSAKKLDKTCETFQKSAILSGHTDWARALRFVQHRDLGLLLISASQDKIIRFYRIQKNLSAKCQDSTSSFDIHNSLKLAKLDNLSLRLEFTATEHFDWIVGIDWNESSGRLLSVSADCSIILWKYDAISNNWRSDNRLGELSSSKGSISATGSSGGLYNACFMGDNTIIASTAAGTLRRWIFDDFNGWIEAAPITGHSGPVKGLAWEPKKRYFMTASHDMTVKLWAPFNDSGWREMSRAQIHGYEINDIAMIDAFTLVSAADEKVIRVFKCTQQIRSMLKQIGIVFDQDELDQDLPLKAHVPLLGLSNKIEADNCNIYSDMQMLAPTEEMLQKGTLWPEIEKIYGHGYELLSVATSNRLRYIASSCKSSLPEFAAIRIYSANSFEMVGEPLVAHSSSVCRIRFSPDDKFILSVSKDRHFALFREIEGRWQLAQYKLAHSRIIWSADWAKMPQDSRYTHCFALASRDRKVDIWACENSEEPIFECISKMEPERSAVTAVTFYKDTFASISALAIGYENGNILYGKLNNDLQMLSFESIHQSKRATGAITQLEWFKSGTSSFMSYCSDDSKVCCFEQSP